MKLATVVLATLFSVILGFAQDTVGLEKIATRLEPGEVEAFRSIRLPKMPVKGVKAMSAVGQNNAEITQAPAVIEVTGSPNGGHTQVTFRSMKGLPSGTQLIFQMSLPNGEWLMLDAWRISNAPAGENWRVYTELWNGTFPGVWPSGATMFVVLMNLPDGRTQYAYAPVLVRACCWVTGPIERADVAMDGQSVLVTGLFSGDVVATIQGQPVEIVRFPKEVWESGRIYLSDWGPGEKVLTVCSNGACSTRLLYVPNLTPIPGKG